MAHHFCALNALLHILGAEDGGNEEGEKQKIPTLFFPPSSGRKSWDTHLKPHLAQGHTT